MPIGAELGIGALDGPKPRSQWQLFRSRFLKHRLAVFSLVLLILLIFACFAANLVAPFPANQQDLAVGAVGPNAHHWLGTDELGRDMLSEILYAGRTSLRIGLTVAFLSTLLGTVVGAISGYFGKWADQGLMRLTDLFLVIPQLVVLAIAIQGFGSTQVVIALSLAALFWMGEARVVRGQVLALREREFVEAARSIGASPMRVVFRHIIPNCLGPILVGATLGVAGAILTESALSYLGFGVQLPATSWGNLLSSARGYVGTPQAYLIYFPGLMILITVLAVNFLGDGLRDALDPYGSNG
ncbi:MAG: ABC transporter permease subunit [Actinobacteria bacterium]|nr:ABC transporter permease subunit [Actinomycetota bacterium]MSW04830.1 ABC transporter permease subunit [Actinomycetota bacterium]MSX32031.1 ABC transporter permease subunit [Actinomycetota bacterium]MSZ28802.1 ABC transporter permease subunit [Actinomycetota bacterium]